MSADLLRRAAASMRERAEAATPGPLEVSHWRERGETTHHTLCKTETRVIRGEERGGFLVRQVAMTYADARGHADFVHIASWHPAVALAVADWLERAADEPWCCDECKFDPANENRLIESAVAVARTYLGASA